MKLTLLTFIFLNSFLFLSQAPSLDWVVSNTGVGYADIATGVVVDASGNSYTIGTFMGPTDFNPGPGVFLLSPVGYEDIFIQKMDVSGQFVWAIQIEANGPNENDHAAWICIDNNNDLIVTGNFAGTADFDPSANSFNLTSNGYSDCFVAKYNNNGNFIWAKSLGGGNIDAGRSVVTLSNNDIIVSGQFFGPVDFDPGNGTFLISPNQPYNNGSYGYSTDNFTLRLSSSGNFIWANILGDYSDELSYCAVDTNDDIIQIGRFTGTIDIDPSQNVFNLYGGPNYSTFIRKLSNSGNLIWAKTIIGSPTSCDPLSLSVDLNNDILITGYFFGNVDFDPSQSIFNLTSNGANDCFLAKYNTNGDFIWGKSIGGNANGNEAGASITTDNMNNIFVVGYLESDGSLVDFDNGPNSYYLADEDGTFLAKYNSNGDLQWATRVQRSLDLNQIFYCWETSTGSGFTGGKCIEVVDNSIYIVGAFSHSIDFDPSIGEFFLSTTGTLSSTDVFIHKLNECQSITQVIDTMCCTQYTAPNGAIFSESGNYNCILNNPNGCDTTFLINLIITSPPETPIVTLTNNVNLSTQLQNNSTYQWVFCSDNISIVGAVNSNYIAVENSLYYVIVTNECGSDSSECTDVIGIGLNEDHLSYNIFPNPSNSDIYLVGNMTIKNKPYTIYDLSYRLIQTGIINDDQKISVNNISKGIYLIEIEGRLIRFTKD